MRQHTEIPEQLDTHIYSEKEKNRLNSSAATAETNIADHTSAVKLIKMRSLFNSVITTTAAVGALKPNFHITDIDLSLSPRDRFDCT